MNYGYVAYNKFTTRYLTKHPKVRTKLEVFATYGAAQAAITREAKRGAINPTEFLIAEYLIFKQNIEMTETVTNLMSGKQVTQSVNTPWASSVASETYWSS